MNYLVLIICVIDQKPKFGEIKFEKQKVKNSLGGQRCYLIPIGSLRPFPISEIPSTEKTVSGQTIYIYAKHS